MRPPELSEAIGLDHLIELHWNRFQQDSYSGFIIEKSTDGKNFTAVNSIPYFSSLPDSAALLKDTVARGMYDMLKQSHIMMDSVKENYTNYYYRIKGINAFAEWSGYSKPVMVMTKDMKPPSTAVVAKPEYLDKKRIKLQWVRNITEPDFKGYTVSRATNVQGPYELLTKNALDKMTTALWMRMQLIMKKIFTLFLLLIPPVTRRRLTRLWVWYLTMIHRPRRQV